MDDAAAVDDNDVLLHEAATADQNARSYRVLLEDIGARIGGALMNPAVAVNTDAFLDANQSADPAVPIIGDTPPAAGILVASSSLPRSPPLQRTRNSSGGRAVIIEDVIIVPARPESSSGQTVPTRKRKR